MGFSHSNALRRAELFHLKSLALAFLILAPSPPVVQPAAAPQAPLEPLNTLYQILHSMVKVIGCFMKWWQSVKTRSSVMAMPSEGYTIGLYVDALDG